MRSRVSDHDARLALTAAEGCFRAFQGEIGVGEATTAHALAAGRLAAPVQVMASAALIISRALTGRVRETAQVARDAYAVPGTPQVLRNGLVAVHSRMLVLNGHLHEAADLIAGQGPATQRATLPRALAGALGHHALAQGKVDSAVRHLREALAGVDGVTIPVSDHRCLIDLTTALAMRGEHQGAQETLSVLDDRKHPGQRYLDTEVELARAWVAVAAGALGNAGSIAHRAATAARTQGMAAYEVLALHTVVRFGDPGPAGRLAELAELIDGPRARTAALQAESLSRSDGDGLLQVSVRWAEIGDALAAAEAAAQAVHAYARAGRKGSEHTARAHLHRLLTACEGARAPAVMSPLMPSPLTAREQEVVSLAARGNSNTAIATQLVVSVRTVEGHLYRAYAKLGVSARDELATLLDGGT